MKILTDHATAELEHCRARAGPLEAAGSGNNHRYTAATHSASDGIDSMYLKRTRVLISGFMQRRPTV